MSAKPSPPKHLAPETKAWFSAVADAFDLEPHHTRLLTLASESWDRCQQARVILAKEGISYTDRFGQPHAHPLLAVERDSRLAFARLVRELGLDAEAPDTSRPPALKYPGRR
jgi:P27 family predicted phage terminase small subunit